jgi:hypothetical protein
MFLISLFLFLKIMQCNMHVVHYEDWNKFFYRFFYRVKLLEFM